MFFFFIAKGLRRCKLLVHLFCLSVLAIQQSMCPHCITTLLDMCMTVLQKVYISSCSGRSAAICDFICLML